MPETKAAYFQRSLEDRNRLLLQLANQYVDFARFDRNGSDTLDNLELIVNANEAEPSLPLWQGCGVASNPTPMSLDGIGLTNLVLPMTNTATNLITVIHENAHALVNMVDLYGFDVGRLDLGSFTCGDPDEKLFAPSAWHKLHWGWITPTVVSKDGYYDIRRADTTGDAFLLYDPDRGTDDYFLLENRRMTPGTYDRGVSAEGLVIWRIADDQLGLQLRRSVSCAPPRRVETWNGANRRCPGTMSQPVVRRDGLKGRGPRDRTAGEVVRAYLDVSGPGILVDTYPLTVPAGSTHRRTREHRRRPDHEHRARRATPSSSRPSTCRSAGRCRKGHGSSAPARSFARLIVTPDANAALGARAITISGFSQQRLPGVATDSPLTVEVVLTPSKVDLSAVGFGAPAGSSRRCPSG